MHTDTAPQQTNLLSKIRTKRMFQLTGLLAPGLLAVTFAFALPVIVIVRMSLNKHGNGGQLISTLTLDSYVQALTDPFYWKVIGNTLMLGLVCGVAAVILSYPLALFLTRTRSTWKGVLIALAIAPLLTSAVARTYGWIAILGNQGVINDTLSAMNVIDAPIQLSNNLTGTIIALTEILMPYAVLAMISGFGRLEQSLEEAAGSLGASPVKVFLKVTLPLSLPGVFTGFLLVFVLAISSFVTPRLLGGGRVFILATEVYNEATQSLNWPLASALSIILLMLFGVLIVMYQRIIRKYES